MKMFVNLCVLGLAFLVNVGASPVNVEDIDGPPLGPEDFSMADQVQDDFEFERDPIELAGQFEGDIILPSHDNTHRNAVRDPAEKWPKAIIPYTISSRFSKHERRIIAKSIQILEKKTCIRVKPRTNERAYIKFVGGEGCSSYVGMQGGKQDITLGVGCLHQGIILHELMHAAGFSHEHSRSDRDEYIKINYENIREGKENNFDKKNLIEFDNLGTKYDYCSLMHYSSYTWSKNEKPTIVALKNTRCELGKGEDFSDTDILKLNKLYQC